MIRCAAPKHPLCNRQISRAWKRNLPNLTRGYLLTVAIPMTRKHEGTKPMKPAEKPPTRVLLVEDNPDDANLISGILHEAHHERFEVEHIDRFETALERIMSGG